MNDLFDLLRTEIAHQLDTFDRALAANDVSELVRAVHSLAGAARVADLVVAEQLAVAMEVRAAAGLDAAAIVPLRRAADLFRRLSQVTDEAELAAWHTNENIEGALGALAAVARETLAFDTDPMMLEMFRLEVENQTSTLNGGLVALEADPTQHEAVEAVLRGAHSIKGAARIINLDAVVELAHAMEDVVVGVRDRGATLDPESIDLLLVGTDLLGDAGAATRGDFATWLAEKRPLIARTVEGLRDSARGTRKKSAELPVIEAPVEPKQQTKSAALDRVVRVSVASVDRLVGLAGESLVEARRLPVLADGLHQMVRRQTALRDVLDELAHAASDRRAELLELARTNAAEIRSALVDRAIQLEEHVRFSEDLSGRLYRETLASRMRPIGDVLKGFTRLVRDLGRKLGKQVELAVVGGDTGVDRDILEMIEGPLTHIIRNAIDHGIETEAERHSAGKPDRATVTIEARHRAGTLSVTVSDDGRGIDVERIRQRAVARGLLAGDAPMSATAAMECLFAPGFSTAAEVTEISGRGIGLDVVQNVVQAVGGTVRISSELGRGTSFHLQLPLTRSVMRALAVEIAGEAYAFPLARVERIAVIPRGDIIVIEGRPCCRIEDRAVPLISAAQVLELEGAAPPGDDVTVVVIGDRARTIGILVDRLVGELDLVVRTLDRRLGKVADLSAAAIVADGSPLLIIDVEDILRSAAYHLQSSTAQLARGTVVTTTAAKHVLVVDDTITVREVERQLLEARGYRVSVAVDGMDAWQRALGENFDLVITDVDMPRLDGIELVRSIRQDPRLADLPVMIVSYRDREEDRRRGLEVGANHYLTKSDFADDKLVQAVVDLVGEPR